MGTPIWLHVGQGGIQISQTFWEYLIQPEANKNVDDSFYRGGYLRSVVVDSESKVVKKMKESKSIGGLFRVENCIFEYSGRGNNWGFGYHDSKKMKRETRPKTSSVLRSSVQFPSVSSSFNFGRPSTSSSGLFSQPDGPVILLDQAMQAIRKEAESTDFYAGTIITHSMGGGTGSGLGSHLMEEIRDSYPYHRILSVAVTPFQEGGETPLQSYNSLLTLSWLQEYADGIILFQNGQLMKSLSPIMAKLNPSKVDSKGLYRLSVEECNLYIASAMAGLFLPTFLEEETLGLKGRRKGFGTPFDMGDLITNVCPMSDAKFMELTSYPFVTGTKKGSKYTPSWKELNSGLQSLSSRYSEEEVIRSSLSQLIVRGDTDGGFSRESSSIRSSILKHQPHVGWNPFPLDIKISKRASLPAHNLTRNLTLISNRSSHLSLLENVLYNAKAKFEVGAYLHWYQRYGVEEDTFVKAFDTVEKVVESYRYLQS